MKQIQTKYEAPKVELIELQAQGVLCSSTPTPLPESFNGTGFKFGTKDGADWDN